MVDTRSTEEILGSHPKWRYDRTDRNGTRYFNDYTCDRCGGQGGAALCRADERDQLTRQSVRLLSESVLVRVQDHSPRGLVDLLLQTDPKKELVSDQCFRCLGKQ